MRLWLRGMKPLVALLSLEMSALDMMELSSLLSKTACIADVVVILRGGLGGVVGGVVVVVLVDVDEVAGLAFCRHLPYRSQIGLGLGVGRSGGEAGAGELAGSRGGEVVVGEGEAGEVGEEVVGGMEVGVEVEVVVIVVGLLELLVLWRHLL